MKTKEEQCDLLIQCGIAKLFSENSTYLLNEKYSDKQSYNLTQAVKYIDKFFKTVEKKQPPESIETLELLTIALNDGISGMRKELLTTKIDAN